MKLPYVIRIVLLLTILFTAFFSKAQQNEDLLNMLIKKNVISQQEADSLRADEALKQQAKKEKETPHIITIGSRALQISGLIQTVSWTSSTVHRWLMRSPQDLPMLLAIRTAGI